MQEEIEIHNCNINAARRIKNKGNERVKNDYFLYPINDLHQFLQCPKANNSLVYYHGKLATWYNNLTVCIIGLQHWLLLHLEWNCWEYWIWWNRNLCSNSLLKWKSYRSVTEFKFFSDNCCGQNRNKCILGL